MDKSTKDPVSRGAKAKSLRLALQLGIGALVGIPIGKFLVDQNGIRTQFGEILRANPWPTAAVILGLTVLWGLATIRMLKKTDELDVSDHLWSCTIAFSGFCLFVPAWAGLAYIQLVPAPGIWEIYFVTIILAYAGYGYRKYRIWVA
jgi:hypothetical protein